MLVCTRMVVVVVVRVVLGLVRVRVRVRAVILFGLRAHAGILSGA
jgi:hypothetical protein